MTRPGRFFVAFAIFVLVASRVLAADPPKVSYYKDVRPLFQIHCQGCHQPAKSQGGVVVTGHSDLMKKDEKGNAVVTPGKPEASELIAAITPQKGTPAKMPKDAPPLHEIQVEKIKQWIAQGAIDDTPASAKIALVDADHPPVYVLPPVITSLDYSPDSTLLAVAGYHEVILHKADGSTVVARLVGESERIQAVAFSPDGKLLAIAGGTPARFGEIQVWDVAKKSLKLSVPATFDTVNGLSWSPDGTKLAFGCNDNTVRAIEAATGKQVLFQGAHNDWVLDTTFSLDGTYLVSASRDRTLKLIEVGTQRFVDNVTSITPGALKGGLAAVALRPMKERKMIKPIETAGGGEKLYNEVLTAGSDGTPRLYKMHRETKRVIGDDANKVREFEKMPGRIYALGFSADGTLFAAGSSHDGTGEARIYQTNDGKKVSTLAGQKGAVYAVKFRPDGKAVASAGFDGMVRLNDPVTGKLLKEFVPVLLTTKVAGK